MCTSLHVSDPKMNALAHDVIIFRVFSLAFKPVPTGKTHVVMQAIWYDIKSNQVKYLIKSTGYDFYKGATIPFNIGLVKYF